MQPTSGQIDSGDENEPAPTAKPGRTSRMRTIQPLSTDFKKPRLVLDGVKKPSPAAILQPPVQHPVAQPVVKQSMLHDDAAPHPVAPRQTLAQLEAAVQAPADPAPAVPVNQTPAPQPEQPAQHQPPQASTPPAMEPLHAAVATQAPLPAKPAQPANPLPQPVARPAEHPATGQSKPATPAAPPQQTASHPKPEAPKPPAASHTEPPKPKLPAKSQPVPVPPRAPASNTFTIDTNETLMRSSNPLAATLSGIELLIKRNGIVSIAYVSIFLGITGVLLGILYGIGRFGRVEFLQVNFSVIALIIIGILLNITYLCSFIVCVASEAGQSISLRQISYLARQSLHKLLALQVITIAATFGGLLLGIIPGVIIMGRWMMAPFMIFESDHPSTMTAIRRSNKLTKGRTIEMTGLVFTQVLLLSTGLLGFAAMAAGPAARYQQLRMRLHDKTAVTKVHFLNYIMSILLGLSLLGAMTGTGYQLYKNNQTVCYSTIKFVSGRPSPVNVCVKRHVCLRDIICRETIDN